MTVYVESNFVLELALEQEQCEACEAIQQLAADARIALVIPAFCLAEPHQALALKAKARNRLGSELRTHLVELGRSRAYRAVPEEFARLGAVLSSSAEREQDGLQRSISHFVHTAVVIPLDATIFSASADLHTMLDLPAQDALVLASVIQHLRLITPERSCFLSRNSRDFDRPEIKETLAAFRCEYFPDFGHAANYLTAKTAP